MQATIVGGFTYCGGLYARKARDFLKEQGVRFDARYADSLRVSDKGIRIDVKAMKAVALVDRQAVSSSVSDYFDKPIRQWFGFQYSQSHKPAGVSSPLAGEVVVLDVKIKRW